MIRPSFGLVRGAQRAGKHRFDVVFYTPSVGGMISCAESLPGRGAEAQVLILAKELARRWWDVLALSPVSHDSSPATEAQTRCAA